MSRMESFVVDVMAKYMTVVAQLSLVYKTSSGAYSWVSVTTVAVSGPVGLPVIARRSVNLHVAQELW